jgi:mannose-1-phosphate guanylyltransferase/mannose-1-phosphate guanylyltransferase/mannose-6-phosphate isomerase
LGIEAKSPETGFGYLRQGDRVGDHAFKVAQFVEKPDPARAEQFLAEGGYAWNGGIFAFRAGTFLAELQAHRPKLFDAVKRAVEGGTVDGHRFHPDPAAFAEIESESVDYAVMENTAKAAMVPADMGWSDIGNWQALHVARPRDEAGNAVSGRAELIDCRNVLVESDGPRVSVIGLEGVIVVVDGNEILVTSAAGAQRRGGAAGRQARRRGEPVSRNS